MATCFVIFTIDFHDRSFCPMELNFAQEIILFLSKKQKTFLQFIKWQFNDKHNHNNKTCEHGHPWLPHLTSLIMKNFSVADFKSYSRLDSSDSDYRQLMCSCICGSIFSPAVRQHLDKKCEAKWLTSQWPPCWTRYRIPEQWMRSRASVMTWVQQS